MKKQPHEIAHVGLKDADGIFIKPVRDMTKFMYDRLTALYEVDTLYYLSDTENKRPIHSIIIPASEAIYKMQQRWAPLACAYVATEAFLRNLMGTVLDEEDRKWFLAHGLLEPGGLPLPYTARVIQELVAPYGFRVSRIRLQPGMQLTGDLAEWRTHIGMNPLAQIDRATTNEQYAAATGMDLAAANDMFRMEYHEVGLRPAVICEASPNSAHGHASFASPRRKQSDHEWLSLQIARTERDPWPGAEPKWEPVIAGEEEVLDLWAMARVRENKMRPKGTTTFPLVRNEFNGSKKQEYSTGPRCEMCDEKTANVGRVCSRCWSLVWSEFRCADAGCKTHFTAAVPVLKGFSIEEDRVEAACPKCQKVHHLAGTTTLDAGRLIRALAGRFHSADRALWRQRFQPKAWFDEHGRAIH